MLHENWMPYSRALMSSSCAYFDFGGIRGLMLGPSAPPSILMLCAIGALFSTTSFCPSTTGTMRGSKTQHGWSIVTVLGSASLAFDETGIFFVGSPLASISQSTTFLTPSVLASTISSSRRILPLLSQWAL